MTHSDQIALEIEESLVKQHGQLLSPRVLPGLLGYCSVDAYRKAVSRRTVPVAVFKLQNRRGNFALAKDVARWLSEQRVQAIEPVAHSGTSHAFSLTSDKVPALVQSE
jgi:hypothetical protein